MRVFEEHPGGTPLVPDEVLTDATLGAWAPGMRTLESVATVSGGISSTLIATYHPSAVLRADSLEHAKEVEDRLEADLRRAAELTGP